MKKLNKVLMLVAMCFSMLFVFVGCDAKLKSLTLKEGSFATEYTVGDEVDLSTIVMVATYNDNTTKNINASELTFGQVSTETVGRKSLSVTYNKNTYTINITVYNSLDEVYAISGYEEPSFVTNYKAQLLTDLQYSALTSAEQQAYFYNRTESYKVGDDNAFTFMPQIEAVVSPTQTLTLNKYRSAVKIYKYVDSAWSLIVDNTAETPLTSDLVTVDNIKQTFDFDTTAIGGTFKLVVRPTNLTEEQNDSTSEDYVESISFEFQVVDGYNVQSVAQLAVIANSTNPDSVNAWATLKQQNGLTGIDPDAVVLHGTLSITANDIPSAYKYVSGDVLPTDNGQTAPLNSLKTHKNLYDHIETEGHTFTIVGNYAYVDGSKIPLVSDITIKAKNCKNSHGAIFGFNGDAETSPSRDSETGAVVISNVRFKGNVGRNEVSASNGGIMLYNYSGDLTETNTISRGFQTTWVAGGGYNWEHTTTLTDVKAYDNYSIMIFDYGQKAFVLDHCQMIGAGGPIASICHVVPETNTNSRYGSLVASNDCDLQSWITGQETWFVDNGATGIASQLIGIDYFIKNVTTNRTIVKVDGANNLVNFISVIQDGDNAFAPAATVKGLVSINASETNAVPCDLYVNTPEVTEGNPQYALYPSNLLPVLDGAGAAAAPVLQSSAGGAYVFNGTTIVNVAAMMQGASEEMKTLNANLFKMGDYLNMYVATGTTANPLARMGITVGYLTVA